MHGPEPLLVDEVLGQLTAAIFPDGEAAGWNREVFHADQADPAALVAAGATLSLFAGRRLIMLRGVGELAAKVADRFQAAIAEARRAADGWPADGATVVLVAAGVDRRAAGLRILPEANHVEVRPPTGRAVPAWLRERARARGLDLAPDAAQTLVDLVGDDLGRLAAELDKAGLYLAGDRRVTEEIVKALAGETRSRQYWELTQALEDGNRTQAVRIATTLLASGDDPLILLAWVVGYLRDVWRVLPATAGGNLREAVKALPRPRPEFAVQRLVGRAQALGIHGVTDGVRRCLDAELALKTGAGNPRALMVALVADLAG